ncbi:hypothetical protein [uncultured Gimesia sp.]|uniref:hypothetical protein n=1 Tax=uncultured Gimesia sp. TaxID=1678688 RepID=UPI0030DB173B|tara:strand:- start:6515 stop:7048 length:534 start_codon:yes stop_codon:yes gene_type:complete
MAPLLETKNAVRRLFWTAPLLILFALHNAWAGKPDVTVSADGPFSTRAYGKSEGIYVSELLVSGKTFWKLDLNVPDLAKVRCLDTSRHDDEFNIGLTFVFPGKPGDRKVRVTARLLDECGNILQSRSHICGDARNLAANQYFGFSMAPARYNSEALRFKGCAHLPIQRVEVTLAPVK